VAAAGVAGVLAAVLAFFDRAAYFLLHGGGAKGVWPLFVIFGHVFNYIDYRRRWPRSRIATNWAAMRSIASNTWEFDLHSLRHAPCPALSHLLIRSKTNKLRPDPLRLRPSFNFFKINWAKNRNSAQKNLRRV
jgi:hypothetical protein